MRILFAAARERRYARNEVILRALASFAEVEILAPHAAPTSLVRTSAEIAGKALVALASKRYDLVFCGFYGYLIAQAIRRSHSLKGAPLLLDAFVSNYDTLVQDRGAVSADSPGARMALWLDKSTCALADHLLLDTEAHAHYFVSAFGIPAEKITVVPVGCSESLFYPTSLPDEQPVTVLYYCSYQPLHGVDIVLKAAALLQTEPLHVRLIGNGPLREEMALLAQTLALRNVEFVDAVSPGEIAHEVQRATICLGGHFGASGKAQRTIPGKVYQMLASARPAICADSPANRELLVDGESALLIPTGDPSALANALHALLHDRMLRERIARGGREAYEKKASEAVIGAQLEEVVDALSQQRQPTLQNG